MKNHSGKFEFDRERALKARPIRTPVLKSEQKGGKTLLSVEMERPLWQRALGGERKCSRTFALDKFGMEVYQLCDGRNSVGEILNIFGRMHKLSQPDAETSVTTFLKTLMSKGLVAMEMDEEKTEERRPGLGAICEVPARSSETEEKR